MFHSLTTPSERSLDLESLSLLVFNIVTYNDLYGHLLIQYLLRDILQYDATLSDSVSRIAHAHRTCDLILGVGDGKVGLLILT